MRFSHNDFDKMIEEALAEAEQRQGAMQRLLAAMKARIGIKPPETTEKPIPRV